MHQGDIWGHLRLTLSRPTWCGHSRRRDGDGLTPMMADRETVGAGSVPHFQKANKKSSRQFYPSPVTGDTVAAAAAVFTSLEAALGFLVQKVKQTVATTTEKDRNLHWGRQEIRVLLVFSCREHQQPLLEGDMDHKRSLKMYEVHYCSKW